MGSRLHSRESHASLQRSQIAVLDALCSAGISVLNKWPEVFTLKTYYIRGLWHVQYAQIFEYCHNSHKREQSVSHLEPSLSKVVFLMCGS